MLTKHFDIITPVYEADAVGFNGEPFFNLIAAFDTQKTAAQVDLIFDQIEKQHGRTSEQKKYNPRTLDLDLVLYGDYISQDPELEIPRAEITRYAFVLEPLAEIAGDLKHPVLNKSYSELWQSFNKNGVVQKRIDFDWN